MTIHSHLRDHNEVFLHVSFPEDEEIMLDKNNTAGDFSVHFHLVTRKAVICNEGFEIDYSLTEQEYQQVKDYITKEVEK